MSQIGPYLSQMGPKNANACPSNWRCTFLLRTPAILKGTQMSRKTYGIVMALLASAALSTACTRTDATGPSDQAQPSFEESNGANNGK
jgi:hypothetical protein